MAPEKKGTDDDHLDVAAFTTRTHADGSVDFDTNRIIIPPDRSLGVTCGGDLIDTSSRDNQLFLWRLDQSMQRSARRNRPLNPQPKPEPKPKRTAGPRLNDEDLILCPKCGGEYPDCVWCDGDRTVTVKQAREMV